MEPKTGRLPQTMVLRQPSFFPLPASRKTALSAPAFFIRPARL